MDEKTRAILVNAIVDYDRKQSRKKHYNRYALGIYLRALQNAEQEMVEGSTLAQALYDNFLAQLLTALEKAVDLPATYGGGGKSKGRPNY